MEKIKNFLKNHKKVVIAVLTPVFLFFLAVVVLAAKKTLDKRKEYREFDRKTQEFQEALEKPYREDVYGGKTPEETWGLFLDALRNGDIDLASKYFVVDKQGERRNDLGIAKKENRLDRIINKFSVSLEKQEDEFSNNEKSYYIIPLENKQGEIEAYPVVFYFNPYTEIWKILVL